MQRTLQTLSIAIPCPGRFLQVAAGSMFVRDHAICLVRNGMVRKRWVCSYVALGAVVLEQPGFSTVANLRRPHGESAPML